MVSILNMVGGVCMLLFGMKVMGEGLQKSAGERMRKALNFVTGNRFAGVFTGFMVTSIVQSSTAVSVLIVSFVNIDSVSRLLERSVRKNCVFEGREMDEMIPYVDLVGEFLRLLEERLGRNPTEEQRIRAAELEDDIDRTCRRWAGSGLRPGET